MGWDAEMDSSEVDLPHWVVSREGVRLIKEISDLEYPRRAMTAKKAPATRSTAVRRAADAAAKASRELERVLALHTRFPEEPEIGTVLMFEITWPQTSRQIYQTRLTGDPQTPNTYPYLAILGTNGMWYTTTSNHRMMSWEQLVEFIGDNPCWSMVKDEQY